MKKYMVNVGETQTWHGVIEAETEEKARAFAQEVLDKVGHSAFQEDSFSAGYEIIDVLEMDDDEPVDVPADVLCDWDRRCGVCATCARITDQL